MYPGVIITDIESMQQNLQILGRADAFHQNQLLAASRMEIWHTSFSDPGEDFSEIRLLDADGNRIDTYVVPGY